MLAELIDSIVGMLPSFGKKGYGRGGTGTLGGSLAATGAGALAGATVGSVVPGVGTALGGFVGGALGFFGYEGFGGRGGGTGATGGLTSRDVLDFAGASGSESNFNQLDRDVQGRVIAAGEQYLRITGRKLIVNSAMRSRAEQERLYNETVSAGRPGVGPTGMPVAKPGTSSHESGMAIDIQQGKGDREAINALNQQGLYQTVPSDPVHFAPRSISGAFGWKGRISGPMSGYRPNVLAHGPEEIEIKRSAGSSTESASASEGTMLKLIDRVDDLIYLSKSQLGVNEKMLRYQA
jgi:hypothetical protein